MVRMNYLFKKSLALVFISSVAFTLTACSSKQKVQEYDQPAIYWYNKITTQIARGDLEGADDTFISLESEHKNSPLIATSLQILANAHMDEEEYELANYYIDEYTKRYARSKSIDYIRYLKIKANFMSFSAQFREQKLIAETIKDIEEFMIKFPDSPYMSLVTTINSRLNMAKASLDQEIADLYKRIDKPKAAEYYEKKVEKNWVNPEEIEPVKVPWYRALFE